MFTYYTPKQSIKLFHDDLDLHRSNPNLDVVDGASMGDVWSRAGRAKKAK
ncbi:hypothetical protein ACNKHN_23575 [Shigella flexneri]